MNSRNRILTCLVFVMLVAQSSPVMASGCLGTTQSQLAPAMNAAIFLMITILLFMLPAFGIFIYYLVRRAKMPPPPYAEFTNSDEELS